MVNFVGLGIVSFCLIFINGEVVCGRRRGPVKVGGLKGDYESDFSSFEIIDIDKDEMSRDCDPKKDFYGSESERVEAMIGDCLKEIREECLKSGEREVFEDCLKEIEKHDEESFEMFEDCLEGIQEECMSNNDEESFEMFEDCLEEIKKHEEESFEMFDDCLDKIQVEDYNNHRGGNSLRNMKVYSSCGERNLEDVKRMEKEKLVKQIVYRPDVLVMRGQCYSLRYFGLASIFNLGLLSEYLSIELHYEVKSKYRRELEFFGNYLDVLGGYEFKNKIVQYIAKYDLRVLQGIANIHNIFVFGRSERDCWVDEILNVLREVCGYIELRKIRMKKLEF